MRVLETFARQDPVVGSYQLTRVAPATRLQPVVREYTGYTDQAAEHVRLRELPNADTVVIINLGASWRMLDPANGQLIVSRWVSAESLRSSKEPAAHTAFT